MFANVRTHLPVVYYSDRQIEGLTLKMIRLTLSLLLTLSCSQMIAAQSPKLSLTQSQASHFASLAMKCVQKEYPNKLDHTNNDKDDVRSPRDLHPAFYGCFDWHSTVHGHWMLVHLLKLFPGLPEGKQIRAALNANLSEKNISGEVAYLKQQNRASF